MGMVPLNFQGILASVLSLPSIKKVPYTLLMYIVHRAEDEIVNVMWAIHQMEENILTI